VGVQELRVGQVEGETLELSLQMAVRGLRVWGVEGRALELSL